MGKGEIDLGTAIALLSDFRKLGASKLTIIGGEASLYGASEDHTPLMKVISESNDLGYEYIRMDTNGQFDENFLTKKSLRKLNEISFSLQVVPI
jgi:predicted ATP-dependent serine protease